MVEGEPFRTSTLKAKYNTAQIIGAILALSIEVSEEFLQPFGTSTHQAKHSTTQKIKATFALSIEVSGGGHGLACGAGSRGMRSSQGR